MTIVREVKSRIIHQLIASKLIVPDDKLVVAVSGGMDSMFLLYALLKLAKDWDIRLIIGHINHNIRPNAINDEKFVVDQGRLLNIPVILKRLNFSNKKSGESIEAWCRENRYAQLENIRIEHDFDKVATGHHANDQIETILQRISEKSGIAGFRGIYDQNGKIIRPILKISKAEIEAEVARINIKFIEDETNRDLTVPRNFFRHNIIPQWESFYPHLNESIQTISDFASENQSTIDYFIQRLINEIVISKKNVDLNKIIIINRNRFDSLPDTVKILLFKKLIEKKPWRQNNWDEIRKIIEFGKIGKIYKFADYEILKDRKEWIIRYKFNVNFKSINIQLNESISFGNYLFMIREVENYLFTDDPNVEYIDGDKIHNKNLKLRLWRKGDTFKPFGMSGVKKISDYLINEKINQFDKTNQMILSAGQDIIWVCGRRLSETVKIDQNSKHFYELSMRTRVG